MKHSTLFTWLLLSVLSLAAAEPKPKRQPTIGRAQPAFPVTISFSAVPLDEEIQLATMFSDRLVPMTVPALENENVALAAALQQFMGRFDHEDISMLEAFIQQYPTSRWNASLLLNMGLERYDTGYLSQALQLWESAWNLAKGETDLTRRAIADRAIGEVLLLNARLGRVPKIEEYLAELGERPIQGAVAAKVDASREGLHRMKYEPGIAFKCGPFALNSILNFKNKTPTHRAAALEAARSTRQGTNLLMVRDWATQVGLDYQMAKREPSAQMIYPSVMHWKLDHFAALLTFKDGRYLIQDATFGGTEMWVTSKALEAETDGYFLVPNGALPAGWRSVSEEEAQTVWGKGGADTRDEDAKRDCPPTAKGNPTCPSPTPQSIVPILGMPAANYYLMQATSNIQDVPLAYQPPIGPAIAFLMNYNHNETGSASEINTHSHLGSNWDFNWVGYLEVNSSYGINLRLRDGGTEVYHFSLFDNLTNAYPPDLYSQAVLKWTTDDAGRDIYRRELRDGSVELYSQPGQPGTIGRYYLKNIVDPQGNKVTINYEVYSGSKITYSNPPVPGQNTVPTGSSPKWTGRINEIVDAAGGVTFIRYVSNSTTHAGFRKIKQVIDPFGRTVELTYDGTASQPQQINSIKDAVGMVSSFSYASDGFIEVMSTPYGKTHFNRYNSTGVGTEDQPLMRGLKVTYPNGSTSIVESWIGHIQKSFHWNRLLTNKYPLDSLSGDPEQYTHCDVYEWKLSPSSNEMSAVIQAIKRPQLEKISFSYQEESSTNVAGEGEPEDIHYYAGTSSQPTVVDNGYQESMTTYNQLGNVTMSTDPLGRTTKHYYDGNGIDLLEIRQVNGSQEDLLAKMIYDQNHQPKKYYDAAGKLSEFTYNEYGQVTSVKDALGNITTYTYVKPIGSTNPDAHDSLLESVNGPLSGDDDVISFTYDEAYRVESVTDSEGYTTWYEYDELGRVVKITYQPQGTTLAEAEYEEVVWDRLDPVLIRDRKGHMTQRAYNEMGWLTSETDSEGRRLEFDWCTCGALAQLKDGNGHVTRWKYDDLGRMEKKIRHDGREEEYQYYADQNRLRFVTIAGEVRKEFIYNTDDTMAEVRYYVVKRDGNGDPILVEGQPDFELDTRTPGVRLTYDLAHPRLTEIKNAADVVNISYQYHPYRTNSQAAIALGAGRLSRIDEHELGAAILYTYDELGRVDERSIWSVVGGDLVDDNHRMSMEYDAMGRATEMTDVLGTFGYDYDQPSKGLSRLAKVTYPNGQESIYAYLPAAQHHRLEKITHRTSASAMISEYGYGYGPGGQLQTWTQKVGSAVQQDWTVEHDDADQLRSVVVREGSSVVRQQFYNYDQSGNRVSYQDGQSVMKLGHNEINQINSRPSGGLVRFEGLLDEPGTASVNGQPAKMRTVLDALGEPEFRFSQDVELGEGTNAVTVVGRDGSGNETTKNYEVEVAGLEGQGVPSYDARGNMLNNGRGQSYEWDSLNRLLAISYADESQTEFTYDALSRRVKEVEKDTEGEVVSEKRLLWEGTEIVQERNAEGEVVKRYAGAGVALADDSKYYFTRDHLGSVRQVSDEEEAVVETYTYDAYGVQTASAAGGPGGVRLSDFRYTGHWYHEKSELHLAPYRAYDAELGVWISEDPIQEKGGLNLYGYVGNNSLLLMDPLGLVWHHLVPFAGGLDAGLPSGFINGQANGLDLSDADHKALHKAGWTKAWNDFFRSNPKPTCQDALNHLDNLKSKPEFKKILAKGRPVTTEYPHAAKRMRNRASLNKSSAGTAILAGYGFFVASLDAETAAADFIDAIETKNDLGLLDACQRLGALNPFASDVTAAALYFRGTEEF